MVDAAECATAHLASAKMRGRFCRKIAEGTHICGDPGMQFDSTIHKWAHLQRHRPPEFDQPMLEYLFLDDTACNLASLNLMKFKTADGTFDIERFKAAVRVFITAQEIIVDNASYPIKEIGRRTATSSARSGLVTRILARSS